MSEEDAIVRYLADWVEGYARYKATFASRVTEVKHAGSTVRVTLSDGIENYLIMPFELDLGAAEAACASEGERTIIVALNMKEMLGQLISQWERLITMRNLRVVMANPFSKKETRWVISPAIHHRWTDPSSLEKGLKSLFKTVDPITKEKALAKAGKAVKSSS